MRYALLIVAAALAACGEVPQPASNAASGAIITDVPGYEVSTNNTVGPSPIERARDALQRDPKVVEFLLDPTKPVMLHVAIKSDGSRAYGLAETYCMELQEWGLEKHDAVVRIVDAAKLGASAGNFRSISLGTVQCRDGKRLD